MPNSCVLRRYVPGAGADEPVIWYEGSGFTDRRWLHMDDHGSIIAYTDGTGAAQATYGYGPYGEPNAWAGSRYRYTGQIEIPEAQLYYYKARVYDPSFGRFLQTDPVGYASDVNSYAYTKNDPVNASDPSGKDELDDEAMDDALANLSIDIQSDVDYANLASDISSNFADFNTDVGSSISTNSGNLTANLGGINNYAGLSNLGMTIGGIDGAPAQVIIQNSVPDGQVMTQFHDQLLTASGEPAAGPAYQLYESISPPTMTGNVLPTVTQNYYNTPMNSLGEFQDEIGNIGPVSSTANGTYTDTQTFIVNYGGMNYVLSTQIQQQIIYTPNIAIGIETIIVP